MIFFLIDIEDFKYLNKPLDKYLSVLWGKENFFLIKYLKQRLHKNQNPLPIEVSEELRIKIETAIICLFFSLYILNRKSRFELFQNYFDSIITFF